MAENRKKQKKDSGSSSDRHKIKNFYSLRLTPKQQAAVARLAERQMRTKRAIILRALQKAFEEMGEEWPDSSAPIEDD